MVRSNEKRPEHDAPAIPRRRATSRQSELRYQALVELSPDAVFILCDDHCVFANAAAIELFGARSARELIGKPLLEAIDSEHRAILLHAIRDLLEGQRVPRSEQRLIRKDGTLVNVEVAGSALTYEGRPAVQIIAHDITERKQAEGYLNYLAYYDTLTGLPNMAFFYKELREVMAAGRWVSIMMVALDHFSQISSTFGRSVADQLLQAAAGRLQEAIAPTDLVVHATREEFTILLRGAAECRVVEDIVNNLLRQFQESFLVDGHDLSVTLTIGIVCSTSPTDEPETLVNYADMAKFSARSGNTFRVFNTAMSEELAKKQLITEHLRKAIELDQLRVYYQPQVDPTNLQVIGAEALIRWQHPEWGLVSPGMFIPLAEETGLVEALDEWVLRAACAGTRELHEAGYPHLRISCNMSARQFRRHDLVEMVSSVLRETGLPAQSLELEATETMTMENVERTMVTLQQLAQLGVRIAIDDFGTGYSSLEYLKLFPINTLKIPMNFIKDILRGSDNGAIVQAIIVLAHTLQLDTVAEGVEQEGELDFLRANHCDIIQGFYFSKPKPWVEYREFLHAMK